MAKKRYNSAFPSDFFYYSKNTRKNTDQSMICNTEENSINHVNYSEKNSNNLVNIS